jgi:HPt (histidine-containing phosphotransfer) domain-containing protein
MEKLREYGAKTDEGLARCINNEAFYFRMVGLAVKDAGFAKLEEAMKAGDQDAAFAAAHALKGVLGNLALEPMFRPASELTELLRHKKPGDYDGLLKTVLEQRAKLEALIAD